MSIRTFKYALAPATRARDAILNAADEATAVQYSVAVDWRGKILDTETRLRETGPVPRVLVYVTNQRIGPKSDDLRNQLRNRGILLDIRDDSWFLARVERSDMTWTASRELTSRHVDTLLPEARSLSHRGSSDAEHRAGLLYLELQLADAEGDRNLTKLAYESIVLGALAPTGPTQRLTTAEVTTAARAILTGHDQVRTTEPIRAALTRLRGAGRITYKRGDDSWALHYRERSQLVERLAEHEALRLELRTQLDQTLARAATNLELPPESAQQPILIDIVEEAIDGLLEQSGNEFVAAYEAGRALVHIADAYEITRDAVYRHAKELRVPTTAKLDDLVELAYDAVTTELSSPSGNIQSHLRDLADSYTLLAFLQETPDVQHAVSELFSHGHLFLDTTEILPLFVESRLPIEKQRQMNLLRGSTSAGMKLFVTRGVLNEVDTHLDRALLASRIIERWDGELPFVFHHWLIERPVGGNFQSFLDIFREEEDPEADIADFLNSELAIELFGLADLAKLEDQQTRATVEELWRERKEKRTRYIGDDMSVTIRLLHDLEMYFGVLGLRNAEQKNVFGHEAWLVTSDTTAFQLFDRAAAAGVQLKSNPVMHPVFLTNLLVLGPQRRAIAPTLRKSMPVALGIEARGWNVPGLGALARQIRGESEGQPEYRVRRMLREAMNRAKATQRDLAASDLDAPDLGDS